MIALATVLVLASAPQHVIDEAQLLQPVTRQQLESNLVDFQKRWGVEIDVIIEPSLGGLTAESETTIQLERYEVGDHTRSQGVVLGVFPNDRRAAINMAEGTKILTPQDCQYILDGSVLPQFHAGSYDRGVEAGVQALELAFQGTKPSPASAYHPPTAAPVYYHTGGNGNPIDLLFHGGACGVPFLFLIILGISILRAVLFPGSYYYGNGWRRGGWSSWSSGSSWGGGGGGGGWSSGSSSFGGGGFSGGGASGSW